MMALLAEEKRKRLEAAIKNREYLVNKAKEAVKSVAGADDGPAKRGRAGAGASSAAGSAMSAMEKLAAGGGGVTSADIIAMYGGPSKKKRKRKGNPGVYIQGLPRHLTEVELRIALQRMCERQVGGWLNS